MIIMYLLCTLHLCILNKKIILQSTELHPKFINLYNLNKFIIINFLSTCIVENGKLYKRKMSHILMMVFRFTVVNKSFKFNIYWRVLVLHDFNYIVLSPIPFLSWIFKVSIYVSVISKSIFFSFFFKVILNTFNQIF